MVKMWQEKMLQFAPPVYDTGALSRSVQGVVHPGPVTTIEHRFLEYGIYVARGVGNGYSRGNGGDLKFLKDWKTNPHHRQKRDWFSKKYMYSLHRLNEFEAAYYGADLSGVGVVVLVADVRGRTEQYRQECFSNVKIWLQIMML